MSSSPAQLEHAAKPPLFRPNSRLPDAAAARLQAAIDGDLFTDTYHCALYASDASLYQIQPAAVVVPRSAADVARALEIAREHDLAVIPRGGGTSLSGQSVGPGIVLDFSKYMNRIVEIDPGLSVARVEPGVVLDQLNAAAAAFGLQFGPDVATSSRANLGGMIGNNSAGARSIRYGKTVDHVISLDVLLADGSQATFGPLTAEQLQWERSRTGRVGHIYREADRIVEANRSEIATRFPKILRRVSGYNLDELVFQCRGRYPIPPGVQQVLLREHERFPGAQWNLAKLIVGAEGTLGCVTEALMHLVPLPTSRAIVALHFESITAAVAATGAILELEPSAVELLDGQIVRMAQKSLEYRHYLDFVVGQPQSLIIVEFSGDLQDECAARAAELQSRLTGQPGLYHALVTTDPAMCNHIWACRKASLPLLMGIPGARKPIAFVEDAAVDPARLPEFLSRFQDIVTRAGTEAAIYGHASVGCLHIRPLLDPADGADLQRIERISSEVCELMLEFEGAMSGEHGDGLARSYLNERLFGPQLYQAFREVKQAFDPTGMMNPGKVVDGPRPTENLRRGPGQPLLNLPTTLDFSREGGWGRAAELCNGSGVCRKLRTGTMCPSFMVTGDEEHSTRGRANALRLILSGALPPEELTGRKLYDTYDLCLQCKGCKAECPSNVDAAKLKVEFLDHYYRANGTPLAARMMARVDWLNRIGSALAPLSNWLAHAPGAAWLNEKLIGIDRRRPLPKFHRDHFRRWFARYKREQRRRKEAAAGSCELKSVVLLDDCLTSFCEPDVNRSAVYVLERAGYEVHLAGIQCCGRAAFSKGQLRRAKELAQRNIEALLPWAERGVPIVGCEPSCLLMLVDEYSDLLPGTAAQRVGQTAMLVDTFLADAELNLHLQPLDGRAVLHGHCHQKALVGVKDTMKLLRLIPGLQTELLDSGCCGMAGSFGYEHYDMSMQIAERVLLPAVRQAQGSPILATGFSCRQQIAHGAGRQAVHPVQLLAQQLGQVESRVG